MRRKKKKKIPNHHLLHLFLHHIFSAHFWFCRTNLFEMNHFHQLSKYANVFTNRFLIRPYQHNSVIFLWIFFSPIPLNIFVNVVLKVRVLIFLRTMLMFITLFLSYNRVFIFFKFLLSPFISVCVNSSIVRWKCWNE